MFDKYGDDLALLQIAGELFDMADPSQLVVQLQSQERKAVVSCLWDTLHADDRRKRIAVG